ncbi:hypothetical protein TeGR_g13619 [Tetraparma gracilis]|uniref:Uncharacterized protein n=1 Tax=Tetraparma gracilis TaxID=2962635 RepID=A0ABQ6N768_9STRA|nr:hypothetical protein TeGR_g13619 [Tetraparma gracilis]
MPDDREIEAPISFGSMFDEDPPASPAAFENVAEEQEVTIAGETMRVRQYCFHEKNANRVWPGTFNLLEHFLLPSSPGSLPSLLPPAPPFLELGAATGLLTLRLAIAGAAGVTCDFDDTGAGEESIESNIGHNFGLNGREPPKHIPHTWGQGWPEDAPQFPLVLASDILL